MNRNQRRDYGIYTISINRWSTLELSWTTEGNYIYLKIVKNDTKLSNYIIKEHYSKSTLQDAKLMFDYLRIYFLDMKSNPEYRTTGFKLV